MTTRRGFTGGPPFAFFKDRAMLGSALASAKMLEKLLSPPLLAMPLALLANTSLCPAGAGVWGAVAAGAGAAGAAGARATPSATFPRTDSAGALDAIEPPS